MKNMVNKDKVTLVPLKERFHFFEKTLKSNRCLESQNYKLLFIKGVLFVESQNSLNDFNLLV